MTMESVGNYPIIQRNPQYDIEENIIDIKAIKSILYLGIKGNIGLPPEEKHTIDTFA